MKDHALDLLESSCAELRKISQFNRNLSGAMFGTVSGHSNCCAHCPSPQFFPSGGDRAQAVAERDVAFWMAEQEPRLGIW